MLSRPDLLAPVLRADGMREADRRTMQEWGLPGRALMETAGRACADHAERLRGNGPHEAVVLAGKGNNGGDGLVIARVLHARGWRVTVATTATGDEATEDTAANLALLRRLEDDRLRLVGPADAVPGVGVIVDALLGIGISGELREPVAGLAAWANAQRERGARVLAVDVPSGLDADAGVAATGTVRADRTVAMGARKAGLLLGEGPRLAGEVVTAEIGIPGALLREHADAWVASDNWLEAVLPRRSADVHKYSAGRAVCIVGSRRFTGAAVLATQAAYRAGVGAVICCTPEGARATVDAHNLEVMVDAQPETEAGGLAITADGPIRARIETADAVLMGCGLGDEAETQRLVRVLLRRLAGAEGPPAVLDADALNALADHTDALATQAEGRIVLTPHLGELRRLTGDPTLAPTDRLATVRRLAADWNSILLLKGMPSVLAAPDGTVAIGPPGHSSLATAGTGDVLAGTIVGLMAQGLAPMDAALAALWLGYRAASRYTGRAESLVASDLLSPDALAR
ncbi:MAG: NAD(P)H-hydrate dehydratase [Bacteroidota bacterium]